MSDTAPGPTARPQRALQSHWRGRVVLAAIIIIVLILMGFSTKVVKTGAGPGSRGGATITGGFDAAAYAKTEFPKVQKGIEERAVDAKTLATAIKANATAAAKQYAIPADTAPEFSVKFTGVAGTPEEGVYPVTIPGLPKDLSVRVQTGPAILGTDLRDATGTIHFEQFTNQIAYQNAAAALNQAMKAEVLSKVDAARLQGKTITVVGAFKLINPDGWLVTPAKLGVQ